MAASVTPQKAKRIDPEKTQYYTTPGSRSRQSTHAVYVFMTSHKDQHTALHEIWKASMGKFGLRMDNIDFSGDWRRDSREIYEKFTTLFNEIYQKLPPSSDKPIGIYVGSTRRTIPERAKEHAGPKQSVWKTFLTHQDNHRGECHNLLEHMPPEHVVHFEGFIQRVVVSALQGLTYDPSNFAKWVEKVDPSGKAITTLRREGPTGLYNPRRIQVLNAKIEPTFDDSRAGDAFAKAMKRTGKERIDRHPGTKRDLASTLSDLSRASTPVIPLDSKSRTGSYAGSISPTRSDEPSQDSTSSHLKSSFQTKIVDYPGFSPDRSKKRRISDH